MKSKAVYPEPPNHIDKKGQSVDADGRISKFTILDEICITQTGAPRKLIYLQKLQFENKRIELRMCYFRIGQTGSWVFGRFATMIPPNDYEKITNEAKRRGWIK
jgi:hypothetical protein